MIQSRIFAPPSPPSSPRMSGQDYKPVIPSWQDQQEQHSSFGQGYPEGGHFQAGNAPATGSSLRSYRTSPYPLSSQYHSHGLTGPAYPLPQRTNESATSQPTSGQQSGGALGQQGFTTSVTGSPTSKSSPKSEGIDVDDHEEDAEEDDQDVSGEPEDDEGKPMTAAELRNQKRKMKRFRLTHNQTRFLMSEFARQAHPDAAHRERLSREIPGLSPRQVQVWFQNRRAKLKRLTAEDRERMMRSRALPENFDMTASLHGTFGAQVGGATPGASPASFNTGMMHQAGHIRPLTLDTLRRGDVGPNYVSPTAGMNSGMSSIAFTPPRSATDTTSPDMAAYGFNQRPPMDSPRGMYRPSHQPPTYSQPPRPLPGHERFRRESGETASSPLRSSLSYDSINTQSTQSQDQRPPVMTSTEPSQGYLAQQDPQRNMPPPSGPPYGLGFSYLNYPPNVRPPQPPATGPPSMDMMQSYQRDSQQLLSQHPQAFPEYQSFHDTAPYPSTQVPQYGFSAGQYGGQQPTPYSAAYMQRPDHPPVGSMPGQLPRPHFGEHPGGESEGEDKY